MKVEAFKKKKKKKRPDARPRSTVWPIKGIKLPSLTRQAYKHVDQYFLSPSWKINFLLLSGQLNRYISTSYGRARVWLSAGQDLLSLHCVYIDSGAQCIPSESSRGVKLVPRSRMVQLYVHSAIRLQGNILHWPSIGTTLILPVILTCTSRGGGVTSYRLLGLQLNVSASGTHFLKRYKWLSIIPPRPTRLLTLITTEGLLVKP
jgi:hypothetical protein